MDISVAPMSLDYRGLSQGKRLNWKVEVVEELVGRDPLVSEKDLKSLS